MRLVRNPGEAEAEALDPAGPSPLFLALAGSQLVRVNGDGTAAIRTEGGVEMTVYPGWLVLRPAGSVDGQAHFTDPESIGDEPRRNWRVA